MKLALDKASFEERVLAEGIAVIDCWAPWCAACRDFSRVFEAAAERHAEHLFATLNTHENEELTKRLKITHIPTIILFRDGLLLLRQPGHLTAGEIDEIVSKAEGLDMERVRSDMERRGKDESP
jgi:thioredoxin 1